jgi:putative flippase GtrA
VSDAKRALSLADSTLARFLFVGVGNTLVGLSVIYLVEWFALAGDELANLAGYVVGFVFSFTFNRKFTFRFRGATWVTFAKFALVIAAGYLLNLAVVQLALHRLHLNVYVGQAMGILPYTAFTYLGSKYFVFVTRGAGAGPATAPGAPRQ